MGGRGSNKGGGGRIFNAQGHFTEHGEKQFRRAMSKLSNADFLAQIRLTRERKRGADQAMRSIEKSNRWVPKRFQQSPEHAEYTWTQMRSRERVLRELLRERNRAKRKTEK